MIRNYFRLIYINIEKIIIGNTQPAHDVLGTYPEDPSVLKVLKALTSGTYKGPSEDFQGTNTKIDDFLKNCFSEVIVLVLHICFCFLQEEQIFKSSKRGRPREFYGTKLRDVHGTKWWDVLSTSVGRRCQRCQFFLVSTLNLPWISLSKLLWRSLFSLN